MPIAGAAAFSKAGLVAGMSAMGIVAHANMPLIIRSITG